MELQNRMDFTWSDEQSELLNAIERFAVEQLNEDVVELDHRGEFNRAGWDKCGQFGVHGLPLEEQYGGSGLDALTTVAALERLGRGCRDNGLLFSINAHMWTAMMPISAFGSDEQKQRYLPGLADGTMIGGNGMSEPDSGSDAYAMRTTATRKDDRYVINGSKIFVTNGPIADVLVIFANVDSGMSAQGISGFLVDGNTPGMSITRKIDKMGVRTSPMAEVYFDDCEVHENQRLGKEGAGQALFTHSMVWERGCILANAVGSMQRLLDTCVQYAKQRQAFGQPISKFQQVSSRIVDMKLRVETARQLLYHNVWQIAQGRTAVAEQYSARRAVEGMMSIYEAIIAARAESGVNP